MVSIQQLENIILYIFKVWLHKGPIIANTMFALRGASFEWFTNGRECLRTAYVLWAPHVLPLRLFFKIVNFRTTELIQIHTN